jgi:hypothetical protein
LDVPQATITSKKQKFRPDNIKLQLQPTSKTSNFNADANCNQFRIATAIATEPQIQLENSPIEVVFSRPS